MNRDDHNLLLFHHGLVTRQEEEYLRQIIVSTESPRQFCIAYELVNRNRITANSRKILKEARRIELRPFRFLINKN